MKAEAKQIVEILDSLAGYNDKGAMWSGHGPADVERFCEQARAELDGILATIPAEVIPRELKRAIDSGEVLIDWSGRYADRAAAWAASLA